MQIESHRFCVTNQTPELSCIIAGLAKHEYHGLFPRQTCWRAMNWKANEDKWSKSDCTEAEQLKSRLYY